MENLLSLGVFLGGTGVFFAGCALIWWCSHSHLSKTTSDKMKAK